MRQYEEYPGGRKKCTAEFLEYQRMRRLQFIAEGICPVCGQHALAKNKKTAKRMALCEWCLARRNERRREVRRERIKKGLCGTCRTNRPRANRTRCQRCIDNHKKVHKRNRQIVFAAYGGFICAMCKHDDDEVLTIDHIHDDGNWLRRLVPAQRNDFYRWLIRNNFPKEYQVLCRNCQYKKYLKCVRKHGR